MYWNVQYILYCTPCLTSYHLSSPKIFHYGHSSHSCKPLPFYACFQLGFPTSSQKIISRKTKHDGTDHCFVGIQPVSRNKKLMNFHSESFRGREKIPEFCYKSFLLGKMFTFMSFCLVSFCFVIQNRLFEATQNSACLVKQKKTYRIPFQVIPRNRKDIRIWLRIIPRLEYFQKRWV